jgi:hypothetical protein
MARNVIGLDIVGTFFHERKVTGSFQFGHAGDFLAVAVNRKVPVMQAALYSRCLCFGNTGLARTQICRLQ